jgi:hypothetical protein
MDIKTISDFMKLVEKDLIDDNIGDSISLVILKEDKKFK